MNTNYIFYIFFSTNSKLTNFSVSISTFFIFVSKFNNSFPSLLAPPEACSFPVPVKGIPASKAASNSDTAALGAVSVEGVSAWSEGPASATSSAILDCLAENKN